jgi:hypothetical protein
MARTALRPRRPLLALLALAAAFLSGCGRGPAAAADQPHRHVHHPLHGGTPVVLGDEVYHLELVLDPAAGKLQAYVFDGELENFIRSSVPSIEIDATVGGAPRVLVLAAVPNPATGETVGDTSLFEGGADWLRAAPEFDAVLRSITIRGTTFTDVKFNYPKGNDTDG